MWTKKANACASVTPEAGPDDPLLWKRLNNLEKFLEKEFEHRGIDWTARMGLVRESVAQLIAVNATLQAERDSRFALTVVKRSEAALRHTCNYAAEFKCLSVSISNCESQEWRGSGYGKSATCCDEIVWSDYEYFGVPSVARIIASKACEDEATWEAEGDAW